MTIKANIARLCLGTACAALAGLPAAAGAVTLTAPVYTQNFNSLASTGTSSAVPDGWAFNETGTNANTSYSAGTGSNNAGDTYSFGATGSAERAFGGLQSGSLVPTFGVFFTNGLGATITALGVDYFGEQWRLGTTGGRTDRLDFEYSLNATSLTNGSWTTFNALDFTTPNTSGSTAGARDGNSAAFRTNILGTIGGLSIANGGSFALRWVDFNADGADDGLAVDDFSLTATTAGTPAVPEPATWAMMIAGFGMVGGAMRSRGRIVAAA